MRERSVLEVMLPTFQLFFFSGKFEEGAYGGGRSCTQTQKMV